MKLTKIIGTTLLASALVFGSISPALATEITKDNIQEIVEQRLEEQPMPEEDYWKPRLRIQEPKIRYMDLKRTITVRPGVIMHVGGGTLTVGGRRSSAVRSDVIGLKLKYSYGYILSKLYSQWEEKRDYKDELFEVKLYPQARPEIQGFIARWHMLK